MSVSLKKVTVILTFLTCIFFLSGCSYFHTGQIQNVGLLVETTVDEHEWNRKGYDGLLQIGEEYDVQTYYKEHVDTKAEINRAVAEFVQDGVNLIFGHSNMYGSYFMELSESYPDVHFIYFNGGNYRENVTSLNFNANAMGYFGGMVAGKMTETNKVGIIAAYSWQPEIEGFYEGVKYQNPYADIQINYVSNWNDKEAALEMYEKMNQNGVDVIYPVGDSFSDEIVKQAEKDGIYAIGYVSDRLEFAPNTVLTSTIQHVDKAYEIAAEQFNKNKLEGTIMTFDFQDELITLGEFNDAVPKSFQDQIEEQVDYYMETGLLPNEY